MIRNLAKERTRRSIGTRTQYCPYCGKPLSSRDSRLFCRGCDAYDLAKAEYAFNDEIEKALERR